MGQNGSDSVKDSGGMLPHTSMHNDCPWTETNWSATILKLHSFLFFLRYWKSCGRQDMDRERAVSSGTWYWKPYPESSHDQIVQTWNVLHISHEHCTKDIIVIPRNSSVVLMLWLIDTRHKHSLSITLTFHSWGNLYTELMMHHCSVSFNSWKRIVGFSFHFSFIYLFFPQGK